MQFNNLRKQLEEKTLTPAEKKKREEVAKAIERDQPGMPMGMKMAIATKTAKRVAEASSYTGKGNHRPGWMLKADPELAKKFKEKEETHKAKVKAYGNPAAGKSVKEESEIEEAQFWGNKEMVKQANAAYGSTTTMRGKDAKGVYTATLVRKKGESEHKEVSRVYDTKEDVSLDEVNYKPAFSKYGKHGAFARGKAWDEPEDRKPKSSPELHRVQVTVSEPNHPDESKRKEQSQKFVRLSAPDKESAVKKVQDHYKSKGFEVHSTEHVGMVKEGVEGVTEQDEPRYRPRREDPHAYEKHRQGELDSPKPRRTMSDQEKAERAKQMAADLERIRKKGEQVSAVMAMHDRMHSKMYGPKKEEVENIEELKKSTIGNYMNKTVDPVYGMPKPTQKLKQRLAGMSRAHQRIIGKKPTTPEN